MHRSFCCQWGDSRGAEELASLSSFKNVLVQYRLRSLILWFEKSLEAALRECSLSLWWRSRQKNFAPHCGYCAASESKFFTGLQTATISGRYILLIVLWKS